MVRTSMFVVLSMNNYLMLLTCDRRLDAIGLCNLLWVAWQHVHSTAQNLDVACLGTLPLSE